MPLGRVRGGRPRLPVRTSSEHRSNNTWPYRRSPSVVNARSPVVLITLTSVHIARLKSLRSLRTQDMAECFLFFPPHLLSGRWNPSTQNVPPLPRQWIDPLPQLNNLEE